MIGIDQIITIVVGVIVGAVLIGLVAVPIVDLVIDSMAEGNDMVKTMLGIAVVLLGVTIVVFPLYYLSKSDRY